MKYIDDEKKIRIRRIPLPQEEIDNYLQFQHRRKIGTGRPKKYDVRKMEIGDSFIYKLDMYHCKGHICYWKLITGFKFLALNTPDGVRVWRVE